MGKAFDEKVGGLTKLAKGPQGDTPQFRQGPECPTDGCASLGHQRSHLSFFALFSYSEGTLAARRPAPSQGDRHGASNSTRSAPQAAPGAVGS